MLFLLLPVFSFCRVYSIYMHMRTHVALIYIDIYLRVQFLHILHELYIRNIRNACGYSECGYSEYEIADSRMILFMMGTLHNLTTEVACLR